MLDRLQPPSSQLRREWWWFALVMLLLGLLLAADLWGDYRRTDASERQHLQQQVTIVHDNVVRQLTAINQVLETLAQELPRGRHGPDQIEQLNSRLQAYTQAMLGVRSLSVLNAQGDVLASNQRALLGKNFSQREYFTQAVAAPSPQTLVVSAPFEGALGAQVIVLARRIHSVQGRFDGIVLATLKAEDFLTLLQSVRYSPDMLAGLASQYLESGTHNTAEARQAQIGRWRQQYGSAQGELRMWRPVGCAKCEGHGYHGRLGIHELMMSDETIRQHIRHRAPASDIRRSALTAGMLTLRQDGIEKVLQGLTDMSEVVAATNL